VSGCHEINVVATELLEMKHQVGHLGIFDLFSLAFMRNRPILTKNTAEVAVGEEDGARPVLPD